MKKYSTHVGFLKSPFPLTDFINKIMTIRSPSFSSPVTLLMFNNPKGSSCMESCNHSDVCNTLIFLEKGSPALQVLSIYHLADPPILWEDIENAFLEGMQICWRTVLVDTIPIGTKWDIPKCILNVVEREAIDSFPITSHNHILNSLLSDTITQRIWIICFIKHCITLTTELFWPQGLKMCTERVVPLRIPNDYCYWTFHLDIKVSAIKAEYMLKRNPPAECIAATFWRITLRTAW